MKRADKLMDEVVQEAYNFEDFEIPGNYIEVEKVREIIGRYMEKETDEWISVKERLPKEGEKVQITYLGFYDQKPHCDTFAYLKDGDWYFSDCDEQIIVEVTAWKKNCMPYGAENYKDYKEK